MREFTKLASALMVLLLSSAIAMGQMNPPTNLMTEVVNDNDVVLSWSAPSGGGGDFFEDFEGGTLPTGWMAIDNDGDTYSWENTIESGLGFDAYEGEGAMSSASYINDIGALNPDNWLITPAIEVSASSSLSYYHDAQDALWADEFYYVKLSTSGTAVSDFTETLWSGITPAEWAEVTIDLSAYAGSMCYIAFQHTEVTDMFYMKIDNVSVSDTKTQSLFTPSVTAGTSQGMPFRTSGMSQDEINKAFDTYVSTKSPKELTGYNVYRDGDVIGMTTSELTYTDMDVADGTYAYCVTAVYDEGESECSNTSNVTLPVGNLTPPTSLTGEVDGEDVALNWLPPGGGGGADPQWLQWDDGVNAGNGIGLTGGGTFYCASHWLPSDLFDFNGMSITQLSFFPYGDPAATYVLKVWTGANAETEVFSMDVTSFTADEFNTFDITPITIDLANEYWFGYIVTHGDGTNPAGVDAGPAVQGFGDMISFDGAAWVSMGEAYALDFNWNIAVYVDDLKNAAPPKAIAKSTYPISNGTFVESGASGIMNTFNPGSPKELTGYNIYRDGAVIGNTTETSYTDMDLAVGVYEYCITAVYSEGESACSNTYEATIEDNSFVNFSDDFDTYVAGEQLACQNPEDWTTWSEDPCNATEDAYISTDFASSSPNSVLIEGVNDMVHVFPNYTEGAFKISFDMYVPTGFDGYFNTLAEFAGGASVWGMQVYFYDTGGSVDAGGAASGTFAVTYDEWFLNEITVDLDNDWATYTLNGTDIVSWLWSSGSFGDGNLNQLGGNNFYAGAGLVNAPKYYFDNYIIEGFEPPPPLPTPTNLTGPDIVGEGTDIELTWDAPGAGGWIHWDDGANAGNGIGLTAGGTFYSASHWSAADMTAYVGLTLSKISFFPYGDPAATYVLKVWSGANAGTELISQDVTFTADMWNEIDLTNPIVIAGSTEYWFGYVVTHAEGTNPAGVDAGPAVQGNGDMISFDGADWVSMGAEYALDFNWNIQAFVSLSDKGSVTPISKPTVAINNPAGDLTSAIENGTATGISSKFAPQESKELESYNVYKNGSVIGNTTETSYTDENPIIGLYTYCVTAVYDNGESLCSNEHIVDVVTGVNEYVFDNTQVFPNPASDMVSVKSAMQISNVKVYNNTGQIISDVQVDTKLYQLNTSKFESGIYFFQIETTEGIISKRIIIQ